MTISLQYAETNGQHAKFPPWATSIARSDISTHLINPNLLEITIRQNTPLPAGTRLIPCLSIATDIFYGYQVSLVHGEASACLCTVGGISPEDALQENSTDAVKSGIDEFILLQPLSSFHLVFHIRSENAGHLLSAYRLVTLAQQQGEYTPASPFTSLHGPHTLAVPKISQLTFPTGINRRICSPTSIAMVRAFFHQEANVMALAAKAYHADHDMYGIWPQSIWAMGNTKLGGYLCRLRDYNDVLFFTNQHIPIVASISYKEGELTGAAMPQTPGHLLVVTGLMGDFVAVNDPAARPGVGMHAPLYHQEQFARAWLHKNGMAYIPVPINFR